MKQLFNFLDEALSLSTIFSAALTFFLIFAKFFYTLFLKNFAIWQTYASALLEFKGDNAFSAIINLGHIDLILTIAVITSIILILSIFIHFPFVLPLNTLFTAIYNKKQAKKKQQNKVEQEEQLMSQFETIRKNQMLNSMTNSANPTFISVSTPPSQITPTNNNNNDNNYNQLKKENIELTKLIKQKLDTEAELSSLIHQNLASGGSISLTSEITKKKTLFNKINEQIQNIGSTIIDTGTKTTTITNNDDNKPTATTTTKYNKPDNDDILEILNN